MLRKITLSLVLGSFLVYTASLSAASATYLLNMTGEQEFDGDGNPNAGDLDGLATGSISLDDDSGEISWDFTYMDIADPSAMHIHGPNGGPGMNAGVFIGLGVDTSGGAGTLIDSFTHDDLSEITLVLNDPGNFYVNIHNEPFGAGAVRGQLGIVPEPGSITLALAALGGAALVRRRRRKS